MRRFSLNPVCPPRPCCVCALHDRSDFFYAILFGTLTEQVQAGHESKTVSTPLAKRQLAKRHEQAGSRAKSSGNAPNQGHEARVYEKQVPYFSGAREPFRFLEFFAGGGMARAGLTPRWASIWANDFSASKASIHRKNWGSSEFRLGDVSRCPLRRGPPRERRDSGAAGLRKLMGDSSRLSRGGLPAASARGRGTGRRPRPIFSATQGGCLGR
jgi:hypothetical protein